jgi:Lon protease-like protein
MGEIGLFPLGIVLVPGERAPLHIFEPRYKELVEECLAQESPFGLVYADPDGMRRIGTEALVAEVTERFDDGRLNIVVTGGERFTVQSLTEGRSFITAEVVPYLDEPDAVSDEVLQGCLDAYERVAQAAGVEVEEIAPGPHGVAFGICDRINLDPEIKQTLLEMRSENERLENLREVLERAAEVVATQRIARQRATGNGKVDSS